ncbi:MAG: ABC transporter ATP-binding protein [Armatimonadota bacterium]|nr:ABC transporter ATP-binding protein [Armatimonadota bacterium]MDR7448756.1 ABC transporter ATP-binding protein [Armatimonadota bacterium]MDR7459226.1 ABC transporter ATP-binding protein [Armatimonadota bacterium]MDR7479672.1 ABC transporter ATP-binding protein [Armatimonadota bacterium]MDR7487809.1 ABC transporter ATP-binding protein [Armatimonadota bacterium]
MDAQGAGVPAVEVRGVTKRFGALVAVCEVSFAVAEGEFFSLLGPSGCGKTTTLRLIGGFELPDAGEVCIGGRPMGRTPPNRRETNMVFQRLALFPHYTVYENVAFGLRMRRVPEREVRRRVGEALELVRLEGLGPRRVTELSGGQQQRVALARALVTRPRVLLLDEPLSSLDLKLRLQMQEELKRLQREVGTTFIYVTHDQGEALAMSDRVGVMAGGRLYQVGDPLEIYERPRTRFVAGFIGDANLLDGVVEALGPTWVTLRVDGVRVQGRRGGWEAVGRRATLCLRPERVRVESRPPVGGGALRGRVEDRAFSGHVVRYRLHVGPLRLQATLPYVAGMPLHAPGDEVWATWDPAQAVTVPPDDEAGATVEAAGRVPGRAAALTRSEVAVPAALREGRG